MPPQARSIARQGTPLHPWIEPRESRWYKSGKGLMVTGAVFLGLGAVGIIVGAYGFSTLLLDPAAAGAVVGVGVVVAVPGAVLLPIGVKRQKSAKIEAKKRVVWTPSPLAFRRGGGLGFSGRF